MSQNSSPPCCGWNRLTMWLPRKGKMLYDLWQTLQDISATSPNSIALPPMVILELFVKCPNRGGCDCCKINLEPYRKSRKSSTKTTSVSRSLKPQKCAGPTVAFCLDQGHVEGSDVYLSAPWLAQMPNVVRAWIQTGLIKTRERVKTETHWASGVQFIHICSKWHRDKQKGSGTFF